MPSNTTPDQSEKANRVVTDALYATHGVITHSTARLIAAALHHGPGTALERLASSGQFDPVMLEREVAALIVGPGRESWRQALLEYVASVRGRTHPWTRGAARGTRPPDARPPRYPGSPFA